ncbi:hypothetical protein L6R52_44070, partial [Myxococcota bacterium]|nr:hypothetical protein [Myxococcota bacterium]
RLVERRARLELGRGRVDAASAEVERAMAIVRDADLGAVEASLRVTQGEVLEARGSARAALRAYVQAQAVLGGKGDAAGLARTTRGLARIALASGDYRTAENRFREALVHARTTKDDGGAFSANLGLAMVARLVGQPARADEHLDDAARAASSTERHLRVSGERARVADEDGRTEQALTLIDTALGAARGRPELSAVRRLLVLERAQLVLAAPLGLPEAWAGRLAQLRAELGEALHEAEVEAPALVESIGSVLALGLALEGRKSEARELAERSLARFLAEGAVYEDEPPRMFFVRARVLELAGAPRDDVRVAWRRAVEQVDVVASRLERKMRRYYLERALPSGIVLAAGRSGLVITRDPTTSRLVVE